jgi:type IV pilus assembly protein PilB
MAGETKKLGEILVERNLITQEQLDDALKEQKITQGKLGDILIQRGWLTNEDIRRALASQSGITAFDISNYIINPEVVRILTEDLARKYKVMPIFVINNNLTVAMSNPSNVFIIDELQKATKLNVEPVYAEELDIRKAQDQYYGSSGNLQDIIASIDKDKLLDAERLGEEAPIIKIVNYIILQAIQVKASDIHIEPEESLLNIRYRVDGMLHKQPTLPKDLSLAIVSRIKIMSGLDIAEKRIPQDGKIALKMGSRSLDFRVSTCPTLHGENVVIRVLDKSGVTLGLTSLGFPPKELELFKQVIRSPYGIVLVTGPTGSGKTTTLYSVLQILNKEDVNIMTVEDPVEYQFPGIRQVHVNPVAGLTFAVALRSFLRQDPNIIMVGEIRDKETAEIAVQAALTGHLVLSTLHTNDSASTFNRLIDMGVEPFLVSSSILGVLAQRLIRRICDKCRQQYKASDELLKDLGLNDSLGKGVSFYKGKGCNMCGQTGYRGRVGIYELIKISPPVQELIMRKAPAEELRNTAIKEGMTTLRQAAIDKLFAGLTTTEEVFRVTLDTE